MENIRLKLSDGHHLRLTSRGEGRPVLFIHGWAMHGGLFEDQCDRLAPHCRTLTVNMRGHEPDNTVTGACTIETIAADICEIATALDLHDLVAVGWSMGAMAIWQALDTPDFAARCGGMVSLDMSPRITNDDSWSLGFADGRRPFETIAAVETMATDWANMVDRFVPRIVATENVDRLRMVLDGAISHAAALDSAPLAALWESMAVQDFRKALRTITVPAIAVHGAQSQLYGLGTGHFVAETMPVARLSVFPASGHSPHLEEPDRFTELLVGFIQYLDESHPNYAAKKSVGQ